MASTGLLAGVNPYRGGNVAIDFTSKPTQYIIQQLQHQQAKAEATDKYYKDWEKSLNTAGIGEQERRMFTEKLNQVKGYAIKNKEQINNPSKYGYDAQSTLEAGFKELQSFLEGSKQKTAELKAYKTFSDQQRAQGKQIDGDIEVLRDASLPYGAGYIAPDTSRIKIYDAWDPSKYKDTLRNVTQNAGLADSDYSTVTLPGNKEERYFIKHYPDLNELKEISKGSLTKLGEQKYADYLLDDPAEVLRLGKIYKERTNEEMPKNREGVFLAHTIAEAPIVNKPAGGGKTEAYDTKIFNRNEAGKNRRAAFAATVGDISNIIDDKLRNTATGKFFADKPDHEILNLDPSLYSEKDFVHHESRPADAAEYAIVEKNKKRVQEGKKPLPVKEKSFALQPEFAQPKGSKDIYVVYPILNENNKPSGKYDWEHAKRQSDAVRSRYARLYASSKLNAGVNKTPDDGTKSKLIKVW